MKKVILTIVLLASAVASYSQRSILGIQGFRIGSDLEFKEVPFKDGKGWAAGISGEHVFKNDIFGMKFSALYMQRRASLSDIPVELDAITLAVLPTLHIDDLETRWANLVFSAGPFVQLPYFDSEVKSLFWDSDFGMAFELGWDFRHFVVMAMAQKSFLDVMNFPGKQHWVAFGLGIQANVIGGRFKSKM